jgi:hypothetical protein
LTVQPFLLENSQRRCNKNRRRRFTEGYVEDEESNLGLNANSNETKSRRAMKRGGFLLL